MNEAEQRQYSASGSVLKDMHASVHANGEEDHNSGADYHAAVIQKHWRGYQVRKSLHNLKLSPAQSQQVTAAASTAQQSVKQQTSSHSTTYAVAWRPATGTIVCNRGALQAKLDHRKDRPTQPQRQIQQWQQFAARQAKRYVAAPAKQTRRLLPESACYRLRIQSVSNLPPLSQVTYGVTYELQLAVSLFDESLGVFYGNTCYSPSDTPKQQQQPADAADGVAIGVGVDFCFDVYFHTPISDPQCMPVVEVIMVEKDSAGVSAARFSVGWAQLPLFAQNGLLPGSQPAAAPIMSGTPRYLLLRSVCGDGLPPPAVLPGCQVSYQAETYPALGPAKPLLPPDFLVSYTDIVPGLRRFDCNGQLSTSRKSVISTLASPMLAPVYAVDLLNLQLRLPQVLHNLLSVMPRLIGVLPPPDLPSLLAVPSQPMAVKYSLVVGIHNGRTFVGPQLSVGQLLVQPTVGSVVLKPLEGLQVLTLAEVVADEMVMLVLELLAEAATEQGTELQLGPVLVGRAVVAPFQSISADGEAAVLSEGVHKLIVKCSSIAVSSKTCDSPLNLPGGVTHGMLPINWRALLSDTAVRSVPDPALQFELATAGRIGRLAPKPVQAVVAAVPAAAKLPNSPDSSSLWMPGGAVHQQTRQVAAEAAQSSKAVDADALIPLPGDTRASMSLRLAAKHLEAAASIPLEGSDTPTPALMAAQMGSNRHQSAGNADQGDQQQLQHLAETMQQQISALARAVEDLKEERQTLRSSLTVLESAATTHMQHEAPMSIQRLPAATAAACNSNAPKLPSEGPNSSPDSPIVLPSSIPAAELQCLKALQPTVGVAGCEIPAGFSGAQAAAVQGMGMDINNSHGTPSRAVMQQLHEAGMGQTLPTDVQALLRRSAAAAAGSPSRRTVVVRDPHAADGSSCLNPVVLDVEARDPRTASDIVLQLLAFRPSNKHEAAAQLPAALSSLYFTLQFYHFDAVATEPCLLSCNDSAANRSGADRGALGQQQQSQADSRQDAAAGMTAQTFVLTPSKQGQHSGAGLVIKYQVDGSNPSQLLPGQDPQQAAFESHMAFCNYAAKRNLNIDVWDGDSLLQLGTTSLNLQGLLRQGRELCEMLLEAPIMQCNSSNSQQFAAVSGQQRVPDARPPVQLGHLVLRLINIGKEPRNAAARTPDFDAAQLGANSIGKKVRVRAAPLEPGSPIAKELRSRQGSNSPFKVDWQQEQQHSAGGDGSSQGAGAELDAAKAASDIMSFEQRKVARAQQLKQLLSNSPTRGFPGSAVHSTFEQPTPHNSPVRRSGTGTGTGATPGPDSGFGQPYDPFRAVQWQLLADVDAVRKRQKAGFVRSQLRKDLVTSCSVQPCQGQALLLQHVLHNALGRDAVFQLKVSHPEELRAIESMQEYRQLLAAAGPTFTTSTSVTAAAHLDAVNSAACAAGMPSLAQLANAAYNTAYAGQLVNKGRIFLAANERVTIPFAFRLCSVHVQEHSSQQQQQQQHTVSVEFSALELDYPVNVLELQVKPRPMVVDRTLRYHCPERDVLRASVPLTTLTSTTSQALLKAAAASGTFSAAASRPDVTVNVSSAAAGGSKGLGEVSIRFKCGLSPEVIQFYVWLYGDGCMAKPLEVWQVFVHSLQKVDMRAEVGQTSSTSLAVAGGTAGDRQVVCYSSNPTEVQPAPAVLKLPAGGLSALQLVFKPCKAGKEWVRVHLVDPSSKQLVHAFLVVTEASMPPISRKLEVELHAGTITQRQFMYASPFSSPNRTMQRLKFTTNAPWLLSFQPPALELAPNDSRAMSVVVDGRGLQMGASVQALLFVHDEQDRLEECMEVLVYASL